MLAEIASDALRDRVLVLRTLPQFAALDEDDLSMLAEHAHLMLAPAGTVLSKNGDPLDRVFLLAAGAVDVSIGSNVQRLDDKGTIGLVPLLAGREHATEAVVRREATLVELPAKVVLSSFYESTSIARNTIRLAAQGLLAKRGNLPVRPEEAPPAEPGTFLERTPTLVEKMLVMRRQPLWARANIDALAEMCGHIEELRAPAGTLLWTAGEPAAHSFRLEYGIVRCTNDKGESVRVGGGQLLGGLDALAGAGYSYSVVTETDVILFKIRAATQIAIFEVHPQLAARLRTELSRALLAEQEGAPRAPVT